MNYYIQGNKEKADQIKAAFGKYVSTQEMAEYDFSQEEYLFYTGQEERGTFVYAAWSDSVIAEIIKTHPDYKELELPIEFKDGDIIGFNDCTHNDGSYIDWVGIYMHQSNDFINHQHFFHCVATSMNTFRIGGSWRVFTAYPATKEQRDLLFRKMKEAGYQWDEDKKELRKIQPHYDIANFKPVGKVLVRCADDEEWAIEMFSKYYDSEPTINGRTYRFMCIADSYSQCIPFEGNENLLGTTDMPDEMYINW